MAYRSGGDAPIHDGVQRIASPVADASGGLRARLSRRPGHSGAEADVGQPLARVREVLEALRARVPDWPIDESGLGPVDRGLRRTCRLAREVAARAYWTGKGDLVRGVPAETPEALARRLRAWWDAAAERRSVLVRGSARA